MTTGGFEPPSRTSEVGGQAIHGLRLDLNISHYQLFGLRDADSSNEGLFHQFGILRDDYTPKPAYDTFRRLIRELGS